MKKKFLEPTLKRYELNQKESIQASITWNDGTMSSKWHFVNTTNSETGDPVMADPDLGCFDLLISTFATGTAYLVESDWYYFVAPLAKTDYEYYQQYQACSNKFVNPSTE